LLLGEPLPEATWFKGKKPVKKSKRIKQELNAETKTCQLEILSATVEDSGEYTVQLTNEASSIKFLLPVN
jgi:Immunoglobulin I-set domain